MWIASSVRVRDQAVGLNVESLDGEARERAAASLAWLTLEAIAGSDDGHVDAWHEHVGAILHQHVTFEIADEPGQEPLDEAWWSEALCCALVQFLRQNDLAPSINRHIDVLKQVDCRVSRES